MAENIAAKINALFKKWPIAGDGVALLAGIALVVAFAPFAWRILSFLSTALLLFVWLESSASRAFWRGYLFGLGYFGFGVSWVYNSIYEYGQAPWELAALITLLLVGFISLYPALTGWLANRYCNLSKSVKLLLVYPLLWTLMEWLRTWILTGFPWLLVGQAQVDTPLAGVVPIFGVLGASWASLFIAGLLVLSCVSSGWKRWFAASSIMVMLVVTLALGRFQWSTPIGDPIKVSMIQANIPQDIKWRLDQLRPMLFLYRELTRAHLKNSDLVIWPETAIPTYFNSIYERYLRPLADEAARYGAELLIGTFVYDEKTARSYNSLVKLDSEIESYHKRHLVPFSEFLPLRGLLMWMKDFLVIPMSDLSAGQMAKPLLRFKDYAMGVSICYEDAFGNEIIDALPQANILVNVSNDAWFGDSLAPPQHLEIARLRALETSRYLLRSTNTGISAVIDTQGAVIAQSPQFKTDVLVSEAIFQQGRTPYSIWGNWAVVILLGVGVMIIIWLSHRSASKHL